MAEGRKKLINMTNKSIHITLFIRDGDEPQDQGGIETVPVAAFGMADIFFDGDPGSAGYVFLNGLLIEWQEGSDMVGVSRKVVVRGDALDNALNTNDTVTIQQVSAGSLDAYGSNTG